MTKSIQGKVTFQNIETGFWGIIDEEGNKWMIINMPEQLKYDGKSVSVSIRTTESMSLMMWGTPAEIVTFSTVAP